jgi:catechol 2,3-dioxygenase-like lactoylglutathione lyase family enzyme
MLHHVDVHVRNLESAEVLFDALSAPLGFRRVPDDAGFIGYEPSNGSRPRIGFTQDGEAAGGTMQLAFGVADHASVDAAAEAARKAGAQMLDGPSLNPEYGDDYYAVFFEDRDGNRYEVVAYDATAGSERA